MSQILFTGAIPPQLLRNVDIASIAEVSSKAEVQALENGILVRQWDFVSYTNEDLIRPSQLEPLRHLGDPLADALVEYLNLRPGQDAYVALQDALSHDQIDPRVIEFWDAVNCEPPDGITALPPLEQDGGKRVGLEDFSPSYVLADAARSSGAPTLAEGQAVFFRYSAQIFNGLMYFSLAGGFSAPNLSAVLNETGYLTSKSNEATHKRLLETTLFVLDVMSDLRVGEGVGFKSAVRVRLLHAQVRRRIALKMGKLKTYDPSVSGIPLNQADLAAVLGSFMIAPLWSLRRSGIQLNQREYECYQAAWRHVGFYLGVDPTLLKQYYGRSFASAEASFASLAFDAFPEERPLDGYNTPTYKILLAVSSRPPRPEKVGYHCEYSRKLLGPRLANQLAIPRGSLLERVAVQKDLIYGWILVMFGRYYWRTGWERDRITLFAEIVQLLVLWQLGERRTVFAWREEDVWANKLKETEGEPPGMKMGKEVGRDVRRRWMWLMAEFGVAVAGGIVGTAMLGLGLSRALGVALSAIY